MEVGNGMSINEDRAHFSMWCMLAAPLIAGNDLRNMTKDVLDILTNKEVIAVDQDKLGIQGFKYSSKDSIEVWFKPLENNDWAICVLNRDSKPQKFSFDWQKENVFDEVWNKPANFKSINYEIKNLWKKMQMGTTKKELNSEIPGHDVLMLKLTKEIK